MGSGFWLGFMTGLCVGTLWHLLRSGSTGSGDDEAPLQPDPGDRGIGESTLKVDSGSFHHGEGDLGMPSWMASREDPDLLAAAERALRPAGGKHDWFPGLDPQQRAKLLQIAEEAIKARRQNG